MLGWETVVGRYGGCRSGRVNDTGSTDAQRLCPFTWGLNLVGDDATHEVGRGGVQVVHELVQLLLLSGRKSSETTNEKYVWKWQSCQCIIKQGELQTH